VETAAKVPRRSGQYELLVPPRDEQDRIAEVLSRHVAALTSGMARFENAGAQLRPFHESAVVAALTGGLVENRYSVCASELRDLILRRRRERWEAAGMGRYAEPARPVAPPDVKLPDGWAWTTVDELAVGVQYGTSAKTGTDQTGVPVLRMGNLVDGTLRLADLKYLPAEHEESPAPFLEEGDLLFNRTNSPELVGKTAVFRGIPEPCSFASYLIRVRLAPEVYPELVSGYINSPFGRQWVHENVSQQVGQANVNGSRLRALTVPLAPADVQPMLVANVKRLLERGRALRQTLDRVESDTARLRTSLLMKAMTGSLVSQCSEDESAELLMARVKKQLAERSRRARLYATTLRAVAVGG